MKESAVRNLRMVGALWRLRLSHLMVFRLSFFGGALVDGTLFLTQLAVFQAMYGWVDAIGDFSRAQMFVFVGTFSLINALNMTIFFFGVNHIGRFIREGTLDHYLTKPVSPLLRLTFEQVNPGSSPLIVLSLIIIGYGLRAGNMHVRFQTVLAYAVMVALMTLLWYDCEVILRTLPFFFISTGAVDQIEGSLLEGCMRMPGTLFEGAWKVIFYFLLPYGIMSTVPTQLLTGALTPLGGVYAAALTSAFTAFTAVFWRWGLKHYKSASS
jgi:ABC-2 type transport system permease protein